jgi:hypothetical protein
MDSFGVMGTPGVGIQEPFKTKRPEVLPDCKSLFVNYGARRLTVSYGGDYHVAIATASGRTLWTFNGEGCSSFVLDPKRFGCGIYIAIVHTKNGLVSKRFIVNK